MTTTADDRVILPAPGMSPRNGDRRRSERRREPRAGTAERRRRDRRRAVAGGLLLTGLSLAGALQGRGSGPRAVTTASEEARPPSDALPREGAPKPGPYDRIIEEAAAKHGLDPDLVRAVIRTESNFDPRAKSRAGAQGLMQIMPILARELGIKDAFYPRANVFGGTQYLKQLLDRHDGDVKLALASYNAGPRNVARYRGIPPFKETRGYVKKITNLLAENAAAGDVARGAAD